MSAPRRTPVHRWSAALLAVVLTSMLAGCSSLAGTGDQGYVSGDGSVTEVAVIGVPHAKWGETVKALVVPAERSETSERDLIDYCKSKLAGYKCPTSIEFRTELARTATGKLQKYRLREPYWIGMTRAVN